MPAAKLFRDAMRAAMGSSIPADFWEIQTRTSVDQRCRMVFADCELLEGFHDTKHKHDNPILVTGAAGAVGGIGRLCSSWPDVCATSRDSCSQGGTRGTPKPAFLLRGAAHLLFKSKVSQNKRCDEAWRGPRRGEKLVVDAGGNHHMTHPISVSTKPAAGQIVDRKKMPRLTPKCSPRTDAHHLRMRTVFADG
jgi:hypothetical protein